MRSTLRFTLCAFFLLAVSVAQLSPFVGSYLVVVKIVDGHLTAGQRLFLQETNAPTCSCAYSYKPLHEPLASPDSAVLTDLITPWIGSSWLEDAEKYAQEASFMNDSCRALVISESDRYCMKPRANEFDNIERSFHILLADSTGSRVLATVPPERIFDLEEMRGQWDKIFPVLVTLAP